MPGLQQTFDAELQRVLGDRYIGMFQYGAMCFPPSPITDFDAHVLVTEAFGDEDRAAIEAMIAQLPGIPDREYMDVWYVTIDEMRSREFPQTQLRPGYRDEMWAVHRAHWHAGRFVPVRGPDPREITPKPTWDEIDASLQGAIHEAAGDRTDELGAYGTLNLCRVLYSYETRDVVVGKFQAGLWALAYLDTEHHQAILDAMEAYEGHDPLRKVAPDAFRRALVGAIERSRALS